MNVGSVCSNCSWVFFYLISSPDSCHGNNPGFREDVKAPKTPARWQPRVVCTFRAWLNDTAWCCDWLWDGNQLVPPMAVPVPPFGVLGGIFLIFIAQKGWRKGSLLVFKADCFSILSLPESHWYEKVWLLPLPPLGVCAKSGEIPLAPLLEHWELCWTGPQQEPPLGLCLCCRRTNLLPLGLSFLFLQLPCCADVVFLVKSVCVVSRHRH